MNGRRPGYPRQKLLDLRRGEERAGRVDLARLRDDVQREQQRLRSLEADLRARQRRTATAAQLQAEERYRTALRDKTARQREAHRQAGAALARAVAALHEAVRRRQAVERDHDAWKAQRRRNAAARDQRAAEESTIAGFRKPRA